MRYAFVSAIVALCLLLSAQTSNAQAPSATAPPNGEEGRVVDNIANGNFEEAVTQSTEIINRTGGTDPMIVYLRGVAEWDLSWFRDALSDLSSLGDYQPWLSWRSASDLNETIEQMKKVAPAHVVDISEGDQLEFRVYYDQNSAWTRAIRVLLRRAHEIGADLFGLKRYAIAVFIFDDFSTYEKFRNLKSSVPVRSWEWASGTDGILYFCRTNSRGEEPSADFVSDYFRGSVVHEYTHAVLHRIISGVQIASWFDEGFAVFAEARLAPKDIERNDSVMLRCVVDNTLLPLSSMSDATSFYDGVEEETAARRSVPAGEYVGPDAYQQACSMVRYFVLSTTDEQRERFFHIYKESRSIDTAFNDVLQIDPDTFYANWKKAISTKRLPRPPRT